MKGDLVRRSVEVERWGQAIAWYSTLRGAGYEMTGDIGRQWQEWCGDPENQRIFDNVSRLLADREFYGQFRRPTRMELTEDQYDGSVSIREWSMARASRKAKKPRSFAPSAWLLSGGIASAAALLIILLLPMRLWRSAGASTTVYQTHVGELKDIRLNDHSRITLGGQTTLFVVFTASRRSVRLVRGQAWFRVAHNPRWPFIVTAGDGTITAVGTAFVVTRDSNRVVVTVTEGTVEVRTRPVSLLPPPRIAGGADDRPALQPIRVGRGQEVAFGDNGTLGFPRAADTHAATAWTDGRLTFDNQPLRYVIDSVNRYSPRHISISTQAGALRFSGIVFDNDVEEWLQSLTRIFPVSIEERKSDIQIQVRAPAAAADFAPLRKRRP